MPFAALYNRMRARPWQNPGKSRLGRLRHHAASRAERARKQLRLTHDYFDTLAAGERLVA